jgi:hypothetical protein
MSGVAVTSLRDIKASGNWMWAAKMAGEGARMYDACEALANLLLALGVAIDGGKDSLSMAASVNGQTVKCPGTLVFTAYCGVPDVTKKTTPELKAPGDALLLLHLGHGLHRLGGSSLAHTHKQIGDCAPDVSEPAKLGALFEAMQALVKGGLIRASHDRSDGGLLVAALEMGFAANMGVALALSAPAGADPLAILFAEEVGVVVEVAAAQREAAEAVLRAAGVAFDAIGTVGAVGGAATVSVNGKPVLDAPIGALRETWERTSDELELLQCAPACCTAEAKGRATRRAPTWPLTFTPAATPAPRLALTSGKPRVAILREEGSNGDREMAGAMYAAGLEPWDVTVSDLLAGSIALDAFKGLAFVGGFSYDATRRAARRCAARRGSTRDVARRGCGVQCECNAMRCDAMRCDATRPRDSLTGSPSRLPLLPLPAPLRLRLSYADVLDSAKGWAGKIKFNLTAQFEAFRTRKDTFSLGVCNGCQVRARARSLARVLTHSLAHSLARSLARSLAHALAHPSRLSPSSLFARSPSRPFSPLHLRS